MVEQAAELVTGAAAADWYRTRRATRELRATQHQAAFDELIVVHSQQAIAHAVPGGRNRSDQIVVSDSLLRALEPGERRVLLAHERSHLRHRHDRYRRVTRIAARINPLLRPTVEATDLLLERWADEDAAHQVGSRQLTARALARAALAAPKPRPNASFAAHRVSIRVRARLATSPARGARVALLLSLAIALTAAIGAASAVHALAHLFDLLRGDG
jgi:beta-lactamase regulating signal transducer with metallopeptidase domain